MEASERSATRRAAGAVRAWRSINEVVTAHDNGLRQVFDRLSRRVPELGAGCARQDGLDPHALAGELMLQRLGKGQNKCLGAAIDAVQDLRRDRYDRGEIDDGPMASC